ncbi:MAG: hypothetical protein EOO13_13305 [Chitinophagaceae bacterium]|nr:MAG: hypothetical protein EOO13_13305 [Chitinophagaceae bacterium]
MKKQKQQQLALDEKTRQRISELKWKKDIKAPEQKVAAFIVDVLYEEHWIRDRYDKSSEGDQKLFNQFFEYALNSLAGEDYDRFKERVESLFNEATKQNISEVEQVTIANAIGRLTKEKHCFPARCELVSETGYSHKTVNECLAGYEGNLLQKGRQEELTLMRDKMLSVVYQTGIGGDMKAARLFLEATAQKQHNTYNKNEQNNFIQINGYTITAEQLRHLPQEKQVQIKDILVLLNCPVNE